MSRARAAHASSVPSTPASTSPCPPQRRGALKVTHYYLDRAPDSDRPTVATVMLTSYSAHQEQIVRQMVRVGLTPKIANVVDAWKRSNIGARAVFVRTESWGGFPNRSSADSTLRLAEGGQS
jgi:hypothetical protein